jgi:hypothetical protein
MDFLPYLAIWLLLAAIPLAGIFLSRRPLILPIISIAFALIALVIWFVARPATTAYLTIAPWPAGSAMPGWIWGVDELGWQLTGIVLWLVLGLLVYLAAAPVPSGPARPFRRQQSAVGLLSAATLLTIWSASPVTLVTTWTLFIVLCWAVRQISNQAAEWGDMAWLVAPLLLYWLAASVAATPTPTTPTAGALVSPGWSEIAVSFALLAASLQMGLGALTARRIIAIGETVALATVLHLLPPLIGATLLARLVASRVIPLPTGLLAMLFGILVLLTGVWLAWVGPSRRGRIARPAAGLSLALAGLALLTGLWAGPDSLIAAMRVMLLISGALFLIGDGRRAGDRKHVAALAVAYVAIAGLPPTAGFASLAPLVEAWLDGGRVLLVLALVLLLIPLLAITYRFTQRIVHQPAVSDNDRRWRPSGNGSSPAGYITLIAPLLLAAGTLTLRGYPPDETTIGTWRALSALFVAAFGGLLLPHFLGRMTTVRAILREALAFQPLQGKLPLALRRLVAPAADAFAEAYAILEGEMGLLWLLALLLLFWWMS